MNYNPRILTASILLALIISVIMFYFFSILEGTPRKAEAAAAKQPPLRRDAGHRGQQKRLRAVLKNLVSPSGKINHGALRALLSFGSEAISPLLAKFNGKDLPEQRAILKALSTYRDPSVAEALLDIIESGPPGSMAKQIGKAVHISEESPLLHRLLRLTRVPQESARLSATVALANCEVRKRSPVLLRIVNEDRSPEVRLQALRGLRNAQKAFVKHGVEAGLKDQHPVVRTEAIKIIGDRHLESFLDTLTGIARTDSSKRVRKASAYTIARLKHEEN